MSQPKVRSMTQRRGSYLEALGVVQASVAVGFDALTVEDGGGGVHFFSACLRTPARSRSLMASKVLLRHER